MKLHLLALASLSVVAVACGTDDDAVAHPPPPADVAPAAPARPTRKLVEGAALPTSAVNLVTDPGFGIASGQASFSSFLALYDDTQSPLELATSLDSRSPAGFGGNVALVRPSGASNTSSDAAMVLTSFQGGAGPFRAQVWVSHSTTAGAPTEVSLGTKGISASVTDETPEGEAFDLRAVTSATKKVGGRTWILLRADVAKPLAYGGFFVVHTGTGGGQFHIAAPEVVAQPLVDGLAATRSVSRDSITLESRVQTATEKRAILKFKSRPPLLMPPAALATPRPRAQGPG